jgi:hypothetical protein
MKSGEKPTSWVYILVFISIVSTVFLIHSIPRPFLDTLRIPTFFSDAEPYLGFSYISSMTVYHFTFAYFLLIILVDAISLFFYSNKALKYVSLATSFFGFFLIGFMVLYFLYSLLIIGFSTDSAGYTALVFLLLSIFFFTLDLITFFVEEEGIYPQRKNIIH